MSPSASKFTTIPSTSVILARVPSALYDRVTPSLSAMIPLSLSNSSLTKSNRMVPKSERRLTGIPSSQVSTSPAGLNIPLIVPSIPYVIRLKYPRSSRSYPGSILPSAANMSPGRAGAIARFSDCVSNISTVPSGNVPGASQSNISGGNTASRATIHVPISSIPASILSKSTPSRVLYS